MTMDRLRNLGFLLAFLVFGVVLFSLYGAFRGAIEGGNWVAFLGGILLGALMVAFLLIVMIVPDRRKTGWVQAITNVNAKYLFFGLIIVWIADDGVARQPGAARQHGRGARADRPVRGHLHLHGLHLGRHRGMTVQPARRRDERGQGLAEYALILALIVVLSIVALVFLGTQISTILSTIAQSV